MPMPRPKYNVDTVRAGVVVEDAAMMATLLETNPYPNPNPNPSPNPNPNLNPNPNPKPNPTPTLTRRRCTRPSARMWAASCAARTPSARTRR